MEVLTQLKPKAMGMYSLSTSYAANSLVMSTDGAAAYLSVKAVPAGTPLSNSEYWKVHTDLSDAREKALAAADEANAARAEMLEIARGLTDPVEASGNPVSAVLAGRLPFDSVSSSFAPIQAGSGAPSLENIRAITGWTGANLTRRGKNLYTGSPNFDSSWINYKLWSVVDETYLGMPVLKRNGEWGGVSQDISVTKGITYTFSLYAKASEEKTANIYLSPPYVQIFDIATVKVTLTTSWQRYEVTAMCTESGLCRQRIETETAGSDIFVSGFQLEIGNEATSYEAYHGNDFTAIFPQTIYGGTLDWVTGKLTVTHGAHTFAGTEQITRYKDRFISAMLDSAINSGEKDVVCSHYPLATSGDYRITIGSGTSKLEFWNPAYSTADEFKEYLAAQATAGTPVQIAYKLANPTTIQLTAQAIEQLSGMNTLYGDGGAITIQGRQRPDTALLARIEALEGK